METVEPRTLAHTPPPGPARFTWSGLGLCLLATPVVGLVWARIGQVVESYRAPAVVFPVLVGVFTGLTVVGLVRLMRIGHRPTILAAAVLAAAVAAAGQHYLRYLTYRSNYQQHLSSGLPPGARPLAGSGVERNMPGDLSPPGFGGYLQAQADRVGRQLPFGYLAKGWAVWLSWAIDALLVVAGAVMVTIPAVRVPYCSQCRSWYRTVRNGKIDLATAVRLAGLLDVEPPERPRSARYRLSACQGGCGPSRCELSWEHGAGVDLVRTWLDVQKRNEVAAVLDGLAGGNDEARMTNDE
jgi:hypothetical protein